jgi:hypothetical protein
MTANPKDELHDLVDRLSDREASATLAYARRLLTERPSADDLDAARRGIGRPTAVVEAPLIGDIDELRAGFWPAEDNVDEAIDGIRRWRDEESLTLTLSQRERERVAGGRAC